MHMNMTTEQSELLLKLPKKILNNKNKEPLLEIIINQQYPFRERFELLSNDEEFYFLWEIRQSSKKKLKINLHIQENGTKIGLMRLDYYGNVHTNPINTNNFLPVKFHKYAGKTFNIDEHHIHYYVQGYKPLAWAIPLIDDDFEIKTIENSAGINDIIISFSKLINIETKIQINAILL